jgi:electron transfer flavoprotein alpha subunit
LFAADDFGRVAAPLYAGERGAVFLPGLTGVTHDGSRWVAARPVLGEQFEAIVSVPEGRPLVATLLPGAVGEGLQPGGDGPPPPILAGDAPAASPAAAVGARAMPPRVLPPDPATLSVADAERIVAFGRGAFSAEAVALVERLAAALGAVVAGTRPAADEGWLPFERQVGLTGAIVRPRLYVAVGISGAPYHMVGVKEPGTLIAVNSDPEAPIFAHAHLGIVGDLHAVLPLLLERLARGEAPAPGIPAGSGSARP